MVAACVLSGAAAAGDVTRVVPVCADSRGNRAWVEIESAGGRQKATPVIVVADERIRKLLENPDDNGSLVIPVPRLMRTVERVRKALREMKRPLPVAPADPGAAGIAAAEPAAPVSGPRETPPDRTGSSAPPGKTGTDSPSSDASYKTATR